MLQQWLSPMRYRSPVATLIVLFSIAFQALGGISPLQAQTPVRPDMSVPPGRWAETAVAFEQHIIDHDTNNLLRYQVKKTDAKGTVVRQVVESRQGSLARLIQRNGQPLTTEENAAERERLQAILNDPSAYARHTHREEGSRAYAIELLRSMPKAMLWSYVPGQPQLPGTEQAAVVLDFKPDPNFKPPSLITEGLTGITGRAWIDANTHCVIRLQGTILHSVDFGWGGVLARVREGGAVSFEQRQVGPLRWLYSRVSEHITIREVLVHTVQEDAEVSVSDVQPLPAPLTVQQAVQQLLAIPVPTR